MTREALLSILKGQRLAVQSSVAPGERPQAAVVGVAFTDDFEVLFDTLESTRKVANLRRNPAIAFVLGGRVAGEEWTVQAEGVADEPWGAELERLRRIYFAVFADGPARAAWPGITYVRARLTWARYSDFHTTPPFIAEFDERALRP